MTKNEAQKERFGSRKRFNLGGGRVRKKLIFT